MLEMTKCAAGAILLGSTACAEQSYDRGDFESDLATESIRVTGIMNDIRYRAKTGACKTKANTTFDRSNRTYTANPENGHTIQCQDYPNFDYELNGEDDASDLCTFKVREKNGLILYFSSGHDFVYVARGLPLDIELQCKATSLNQTVCTKTFEETGFHYNASEQSPLDRTAIMNADQTCRDFQVQLGSRSKDTIRQFMAK